ncbi:hypothetical protein AB1L05_26290 [Cytobacillus horneckiae]|uniref:hypothetical protein n=1 Tax=Cytobacillus horneckiae TaxID=549687 RepID=UPI0034CF3B47
MEDKLQYIKDRLERNMKWKTYFDGKWVDSVVGEYTHKDVKWMIDKIEQQQQEIERLERQIEKSLEYGNHDFTPDDIQPL